MHWDCIVIGGGVMGCAAAYWLARARKRVLLLEQFAIGHSRGSSHGYSRIIRYSYPSPGYVRLMTAAYRAWAAFEEDAGARLLLTTGGLDIGRPDSPLVQACQASLAQAGIPCELLATDELRARFPQFRLDDGDVGLYQADAGILPASQCLAMLARNARRNGAMLHEGVPARRIIPDGAGVTVETAGETHRGDRLIITAGPWASGLLHTLGLALPLTVSREQVHYFAPLHPAQFEPGRFPIFIHYGKPDLDGAPRDFYGLPMYGIPGVKVAAHRAGTKVDFQMIDPGPSASVTAIARAYVEQLLPAAAGALIVAETCRYTNTPDSDFILDHHPDYSQILVGSPCSGHGFKFAALVGQILADLATRGTTDHAIEPFGLGRFIRNPVHP